MKLNHETLIKTYNLHLFNYYLINKQNCTILCYLKKIISIYLRVKYKINVLNGYGKCV